MAILVFSLNFGGATFLTVSQTDFSQSLQAALPQYAPLVNAENITQAGATDFRQLVPATQLEGVLKSYSVSVDHVFYLLCACAAVAFAFSWGMGWEDIRQHRPKADDNSKA